LKKQIGDQINQGGKHLAAIQSNNQSIEDISFSCSQDVDMASDPINAKGKNR
jgi:hypothetical protein